MDQIPSKTKRITAIFAVFIFAMVSFAAIPIGISDADTAIEITDGDGHTVTMNSTASHIAAIGKGASSTVTELGFVDRIVVTDSYSNKASEDVFKQVQVLVEEGKATAGGNMYSSGLNALKTEIVDSADSSKGGLFDKEKDVVILSGGSAVNTKNVYDYLKELGFSYILTWSSIKSYDEIIGFVESISKVLSGSESDEVKRMKYVRDDIRDVLASKGVTEDSKYKCFYVTWSSNTFKVGNTGSLGTSLLQAAGGKVVTIDSSIEAPTYETSLPQLIEDNGKNIIISADTSITTAGKAVLLREQVGEVTKIVAMESLWNNYSIDSMYGVWALACAMYPQWFEGDVPEIHTDGNGNESLIYVVSGCVASVLIIAFAVWYMRRK